VSSLELLDWTGLDGTGKQTNKKKKEVGKKNKKLSVSGK
jgi:hypothetical protein